MKDGAAVDLGVSVASGVWVGVGSTDGGVILGVGVRVAVLVGVGCEVEVAVGVGVGVGFGANGPGRQIRSGMMINAMTPTTAPTCQDTGKKGFRLVVVSSPDIFLVGLGSGKVLTCSVGGGQLVVSTPRAWAIAWTLGHRLELAISIALAMMDFISGLICWSLAQFSSCFSG